MVCGCVHISFWYWRLRWERSVNSMSHNNKKKKPLGVNTTRRAIFLKKVLPWRIKMCNVCIYFFGRWEGKEMWYSWRNQYMLYCSCKLMDCFTFHSTHSNQIRLHTFWASVGIGDRNRHIVSPWSLKGTREKPHSGKVIHVKRALWLGITFLPPKVLYFGDFMAPASLAI